MVKVSARYTDPSSPKKTPKDVKQQRSTESGREQESGSQNVETLNEEMCKQPSIKKHSADEDPVLNQCMSCFYLPLVHIDSQKNSKFTKQQSLS